MEFVVWVAGLRSFDMYLRARSRLASSGCQGKISNHLLYSKELHVDLTGQGSRGKRHRGKAESPETYSLAMYARGHSNHVASAVVSDDICISPSAPSSVGNGAD